MNVHYLTTAGGVHERESSVGRGAQVIANPIQLPHVSFSFYTTTTLHYKTTQISYISTFVKHPVQSQFIDYR